MSTIICCDCPMYGLDRVACAKVYGHVEVCNCDCHAATHVMVSLNRAEVEEALASLGLPLDGMTERRMTNQLCERWGIDK